MNNVNKEPKVLRSIEEMRSFEVTGQLGLIPTMGYLHEGHLSLARRAREECGTVAISIFINPMQFGPSEDLGRYPRDEAGDLEACPRGWRERRLYPRGR